MALRRVRSLPARRRAARRSVAWDERHGVETAALVHLAALDIDSPNRELGEGYQASDPDDFRRLIEALPIRYEDFVFVDYGSGKGRALLLASEFPFSRIVGVEFSAMLNDIARTNIARFSESRGHSAPIEVVTADAVDYELPPEPLVLYFYNPFAEAVLLRVLERVRASVGSTQRGAYIVFSGPVPTSSVLHGAGFVPLRPASGSTPRIYMLQGSVTCGRADDG
jgi:SAM-dependent methyltransferase